MHLYKKLKKKARSTRNRDVRIKIEPFLLALKLKDVSEACSRRGFSRKFFYKWWNRFERSGFKLKALEEKSRRPHRSPKKTPEKIEKKIRWFQKKASRLAPNRGASHSRRLQAQPQDYLPYSERTQESQKGSQSAAQTASKAVRVADPRAAHADGREVRALSRGR